MAEAQAVAAPEFQRMTWDEICARYPDEYVMLTEIDRIEEGQFAFRSALVLAHARTSKEVCQLTKPIAERFVHFACYYTGRAKAPFPRVMFR